MEDPMRGGYSFSQMRLLAGFSLALALEMPAVSWGQDGSKPQSPVIRASAQESQSAVPFPNNTPGAGDETKAAAPIESTSDTAADEDHSPGGFRLGPNFGQDWDPSNWSKVPSIPVLPRAGWF